MTDPTCDATWAPVPLSGITELRVHGVGGTPPTVMLGTPAPEQVSGDATAGCWRGPDDVDGSGRERHVEAYAWGGLTARSPTSALWLLALPFALVNIAGWMSPQRGDERFGGLVRVAGLAVTGLYVAFACTAGMDFAAYQCGGAPDRGTTCSVATWWPVGVGDPAHGPARRVLLGAIVPVALLAVLWVATRSSRMAYEQYASDRGTVQSEEGLSRHCRGGLEKSRFWHGEGYAARLAEVHLAMGFAVVAHLVARTTMLQTGGPSGPTAGPWAGLAGGLGAWSGPAWTAATVVAALSAASMVAAVVLAAHSGLRRRLPHRAALAFAVGLLLVAAVAAWQAPTSFAPGSPRVLPGVTEVFDLFVGLLVPTAAAVFGAALVAGRSEADVPWPTRLRWAATPAATLVVAFMVSLTVLAGIVLWVANRLGEADAFREEGTSPAIEYAQAFEVLARGVVIALVVFVTTLAVVWVVRGHRQAGEALGRAVGEWDGVAGPSGWVDARATRGWVRRVRRSLRTPEASLSAAEWAVWLTALGAIPAAMTYLALWWREMDAQHWSADHIVVDVGPLAAIPLGLCTWLLTSVPLAAIIVLRRAITSPSTRRSLAIAWDVATFWPRSFHPLAPPSYAERAVPELQARLCRLWQGEEGRPGSVLLLGHSQGSVLVAAALASLDDDECPSRTGDRRPLAERLSVITYGSPVRRLYARHFPAYFTYGMLTRVLERLRHPETGELAWLNCFRDTDYVGHRLTDGGACATVDCYLPDPPHPYAPPFEPPPPPRAHAEKGYRHQGRFRERVRGEVERLSLAGSSGPPDPPAQAGPPDVPADRDGAVTSPGGRPGR